MNLSIDPDNPFYLAHEMRRAGLTRHSPDLLEDAADKYESLGCPVNAARTREQAAEVRWNKVHGIATRGNL
jgi:hypothetical protein